MTTNVMVRDLDLPQRHRQSLVGGGRGRIGGSLLAVDTTLVCSLHSGGSPHRGAADTDSVVWKHKELRYPELVGPGSRARLVMLALEVGGRWSLETRTFVAQLARAKARREHSCRRGRTSLEESSRARQRRPSRHDSTCRRRGFTGQLEGENKYI